MSRLRAREALESPSPCPLPDEGKRGPVSVQNEPAVSFAATVHLNARSKALVPGAACNQAVELPESVLGQIACRDNLAFMAELPDGCCDLIYADPPFNMDRPVEPTKYGSANYQSRFVGGIDGHLRFLVPRLEQMRRLLSRRGLLFVHLNWRSVHYVKVELDRLFGESNSSTRSSGAIVAAVGPENGSPETTRPFWATQTASASTLFIRCATALPHQGFEVRPAGSAVQIDAKRAIVFSS